MALISTSPPQAWQEVDAACEIGAVFATAPHTAGGWPKALELLRGAAGADQARVVAIQGAARWVVASTRGPADRVGSRTATEVILRRDGAEFQLCLSGDYDAMRAAAAQRLLGRVGPAAAAAAQVEFALQLDGLRMCWSMMQMAGLQPLVCASTGALWSAGASPQPPAAHPRLLRVGERIRCADTRDEDALRGGLVRAAEHRHRQTVVLGQGEGDPLVIDILPPSERHNAGFLPWMVVLPRCRGHEDSRRSPIVQELFGLTPSETAVALGIADGVSVGDLAERRGVATSTVRAQVKTVLAKVGVRRQVELAHRLAAIC